MRAGKGGESGGWWPRLDSFARWRAEGPCLKALSLLTPIQGPEGPFGIRFEAPDHVQPVQVWRPSPAPKCEGPGAPSALRSAFAIWDLGHPPGP
jgi:hypothetical protein